MFSFLPIRVFQINLRCTQRVQLPFFHQPLVNAFMRNVLGSPDNYETCWAIHTPESGQLHYDTGQHYCFYLFSYNAPLQQQRQLFETLEQLPDAARPFTGAFSHQFELISIYDPLTQQLLGDPNDGQIIDIDSINYEAEYWHQQPLDTLTIELVSPTRLSTPNTRGKGKQGYVRQPAQLSGQLFYQRVAQTIHNFHHLHRGQPLEYYHLPEWYSAEPQVFWVDSSYQTESGSNKPLGGLAGQLLLTPHAPLSLVQWQYLCLGQYLGIGQSRVMGFGRYRFHNSHSLSTLFEQPRHSSLLKQILTPTHLGSVWQLEQQKLPDSAPQHQLSPAHQLSQIVQEIAQGSYTPSALWPQLIKQDTAKPRLILIPDFNDKVLQKAVSQWLTQSLDSLYSYASYGYRKGRSRLNVKDKISQAWRQGYRWVVDADIKSFFQNVEIAKVCHKLRSLYGDDELWHLIHQWLTAPIQRAHLPHGYQDYRLQGLPLGSAISPVLANLMLDDFDADMQAEQLQLLRYADDFVILCKTKQQAEQALQHIQNALDESGFDLNREKTKIRSFEQGFYFLGYFFFKDMAIDAKRPDVPQPTLTAKAAEASRSQSNKEKLYYPEIDKRTLIITGDICQLHSSDQRLAVQRNDQQISENCWSHLGQVILFGNHHITTPALRHAMKHKVNVHFADQFGHYQGAAISNMPEHGHDLWLAQLTHLAEPVNRLRFSRTLVNAKAKAQLSLLKHRLKALKQHAKRSDSSANKLQQATPLLATAIATLEQLPDQLAQSQAIDQIRGYEGNAARHYWQAFARLIDPKWQFTGRVKHPATDPVNALLSYGYSMLYAHIDSLLRSRGLYSWQGGYHQGRGNHAALASDMMEPYRCHIDNLTLTLLNKHTQHANPQQFSQQGQQALMSKSLRQYWSMQLVQQLQQPQFNNGQQGPSLLAQVEKQITQLILWIRQDKFDFEWGA